MAKKTTKQTPIIFPASFKLTKLAEKAGIDYFRIIHVVNGNRIDGFTYEEKQKLEAAVLAETKAFLKVLGSTKSPLSQITSPTHP